MVSKPTYQELELQIEKLKNNYPYELFLDLADVILISIDHTGNITYVNKKACEIIGCKQNKIIGKNWFENFIPDRLKKDVISLSKKILSGDLKAAKYNENPIKTFKGEERIIGWHNELIKDEKGNITGHLSSGNDITERKLAEKALKESEEKLLTVLDNTNDAIFCHDYKGKMIFINNAMYKQLGYTYKEAVKLKPEDIISPKFVRNIPAVIDKIIKYGNVLEETEIVTKNGKIIPVEINISEVDFAGQKALINVGRDITERKEAEKALKESEKNYRILTESMKDVVAKISKSGNLLYVSPAIKEFGGYIPEEEIGNHISKYVAKKSDLPRALKLLAEVLISKKAGNFEFKYKAKDKSSFPVELSYVPLIKSGKVDAIQMVMRDISDRNKSEQALIESEEKLKDINAKKDKFFSIIAHDLKNPFNSMLGFSDLLMSNFDNYSDKKKKKFISIIQESALNTYKLLENLLLWSRSQRGVIEFFPENTNLYLLSVETIMILKQSIKEKNQTLINHIPEDTHVTADRNMLLTIFRNLLSNAVKFTPSKGKITINARLITDKANHSFIEISVEDTGIGITKENLNHLFKISESVLAAGTKGEIGTGLGLILCKEFIERHQGKIWVKSKQNKGSTFIFTLPLHANKLD